jgi:fructose-bisphosphate aldolase class II
VAVSTVALLRAAERGGYAVAAVNVVDDLSLRAAVAAAVERSSPLIVQLSVKTVRRIGVELATRTFEHATRGVEVPVALHLDHCPDPAVVAEVVAAGWSSVLFDASGLDLATAERETAAVVALAHAAGVEVESEIENIVGVEDGVGSDVVRHAYSVRQLADVALRTGADLLAPQLGTAHGEYRSAPVLLPDRVRELRALVDRPVVLHGGTGLTPEEFRAFVEAGVSKINISTALKTAYCRAALTHLGAAESAGRWDPLALFDDVSGAVRAEVGRHLEVFGSAGRAGTV